jgi:receptor expression-enhancing protein 5/6
MIGWPISRFLSYPISFLIPSRRSFRAVLTPGGSDDIRFLSYWLVLAFWSIFESVFDPLIASIPFYYEAKCIFLLYLQSKNGRPAWEFFHSACGPILQYYEPQIDAFMAKYSQHAAKIQRQAQAAATEAIISQAVNAQRE